MMIVYRPIKITDLILELLAGMRSYTGNSDLDSRASCKYPAIWQRSHQRDFLEWDANLYDHFYNEITNLKVMIGLASQKYFDLIPKFQASMRLMISPTKLLKFHDNIIRAWALYSSKWPFHIVEYLVQWNHRSHFRTLA